MQAGCYKAEQVTWHSIVQREIYAEFDSGTVDLGDNIKSIDAIEKYNGEWVQMTEDEYTIDGNTIETEEEKLRVKYTTDTYNHPDINRLITELVAVYYDHAPDEQNVEMVIINKLSKYKIWVAG
jgi:hypothetical protein